MTLPSNNLSKEGYTFDGWTVKVAAAPAQCWPSNIDTSVNGSAIGYSLLNGKAGSGESQYGLTVGSGEWATELSYGTIKGMARCSAKSGDNHSNQWGGNSADWTASESELTSATGEAQYCWCQPIGFDADKDGEYCSVSASSWVFYNNRTSAYNCAKYCANYCAYYVLLYSDFRSALFGTVQ